MEEDCTQARQAFHQASEREDVPLVQASERWTLHKPSACKMANKETAKTTNTNNSFASASTDSSNNLNLATHLAAIAEESGANL